ncbi:MAG TPA: hypothetical protein VHB79_32385 [Polyangiaceae bacterium]|nr:hypothetical protein [Polyangiaceae bacterium]
MAKANAILFALALVLLWLVLPSGAAGFWAGLATLSLPLALALEPRWPGETARWAGALLAGLALVMLALESPETWCRVALASLLWSACAASLHTVARRELALLLGLGVAAPFALGLALWLASESARLLISGALGGAAFDARAVHDLCQWLAIVVLLVVATAPAQPARVRWLPCLALGVCGVLLVSRSLWLASRLNLRTDMLIWSEAPLLINLLKLHAGEVFYGPLSRPNSYSYSPALEHVQYLLLRPWGLELSLIAHRLLGVLWQLLAAWVLASGLTPWLALKGVGRALVWLFCLGVLLSSLLAPHLHPDHLLWLCASGAYWLALRGDPWRRRELALLVTLPALATMTKLTGAGLGLGLGLAYLADRDYRRLPWLVPAALLALSTIPLFDATLGHFSDYAIRLQASHPLERGRLLGAFWTPQLLAFALAGAACAWPIAGPPSRDVTRAARRVWLLTLGFGLPSLVAYAKHGGRPNSLLPFSVGAALVLLLLAAGEDSPAPARWQRVSIAAGLLAILTPISPALLGARRASLVDTHRTTVSWLAQSARAQRRVLSSSVSARIDAGILEVPDLSLHLVSELALGNYPEQRLFEQRIRERYYDGMMLGASALLENDALAPLRGSLMQGYVVVAPPELHGKWPAGVEGYVIVERAPAAR